MASSLSCRWLILILWIFHLIRVSCFRCFRARCCLKLEVYNSNTRMWAGTWSDEITKEIPFYSLASLEIPSFSWDLFNYVGVSASSPSHSFPLRSHILVKSLLKLFLNKMDPAANDENADKTDDFMNTFMALMTVTSQPSWRCRRCCLRSGWVVESIFINLKVSDDENLTSWRLQWSQISTQKLLFWFSREFSQTFLMCEPLLFLRKSCLTFPSLASSWIFPLYNPHFTYRSVWIFS